MSKKDCQHERFNVMGKVYRHPDEETGEITSYSVEFGVHCSECRLPFQFLGIQGGHPGVSFNGGELRLMIKPGLRNTD